MKQQTGSRNRGWLPMIGNRLSVAVGVALVAGMMAGTAYGADWPSLLATGGNGVSGSTGMAAMVDPA
jgi:hypothetical protein